jgi:phosphoglycerate kinase
VETAKQLLEKYPDILILPEDAAVERDGKRVECAFNEMDGNPFLDIGPLTVTKYVQIIRGAAAVVANGPLGYFEKEIFASGTRNVLIAIAECEGVTVVSGVGWASGSDGNK